MVQLAEEELHAPRAFVTFAMPCELLVPLGGDCLEGDGYGLAYRIVGRLNDAAATILEPEMSSVCLGINARLTMSKRRI